jgi:hypothetical protein
MGSATSTPTYQALNANIANDGSATSPRGWASAGDANYTFTSTGPMRVRVASPSAARTVTLPTTGIKAGAEFELLVTGATETNYVVLNSSGANEVDRIGGQGKILVVALQDAPTTAAHWQVVDVWEKSSAITSGACTGANLGAVTTVFARYNTQVSAFVTQAAGTMSAANNITTPSSYVPSRFNPSVSQGCGCIVSSSALDFAGWGAIVAGSAYLTVSRFDRSNFGASGNSFNTMMQWLKI